MITSFGELENEAEDQLLGDELQGTNYQSQNIFDCLVIKKDNTYKSGFDIIMLVVSCYNIFGNAYYSAFGASNSK